MPVADELIVCLVGMDGFVTVSACNMLEEILLELLTEVLDVPVWIITEMLHHTTVALTLQMVLETILITALFLAHLAVPSVHRQNVEVTTLSGSEVNSIN